MQGLPCSNTQHPQLCCSTSFPPSPGSIRQDPLRNDGMSPQHPAALSPSQQPHATPKPEMFQQKRNSSFLKKKKIEIKGNKEGV